MEVVGNSVFRTFSINSSKVMFFCDILRFWTPDRTGPGGLRTPELKIHRSPDSGAKNPPESGLLSQKMGGLWTPWTPHGGPLDSLADTYILPGLQNSVGWPTK